ncbi:hypothetical protein [Nocardia sp. NPDC050793]|uniref:TY-Chap domain-containing protein n=1 Tax=Nocardia sp. NPDC050793 TaxID=3155159 RepID=UPI0033D93E68
MSSPTAIFWLGGELHEMVRVAIRADMSGYDLESDGYAHLKDELYLTMRAALRGFRDALGEPVHGTLQYGTGLCWRLPRVVLGAVHDRHAVVLELVRPARREESRQQSLRFTVDDIQRAAWNQATEDSGAIAESLATGSALVVDGADHGSARFSALPDALEVELSVSDSEDERRRPSDGTRRHMIECQGWTPPTETQPRWRRRRPVPAMSRDFQHLAHCVIWRLRTEETVTPKELELRIEGPGEYDASAWPWS